MVRGEGLQSFQATHQASLPLSIRILAMLMGWFVSTAILGGVALRLIRRGVEVGLGGLSFLSHA